MFKKIEISALQWHKRQVTNLRRIKVEKRTRYEEGCADLNLAEPTSLKRKMVVRLDIEDFRPHSYMTTTYVTVAAAIYDVKYTPAYNGDRTHRDISLDHLTQYYPFDDIFPGGAKPHGEERRRADIARRLVCAQASSSMTKRYNSLVLGSFFSTIPCYFYT